jgi:hypothetical protein
MPWLAALLVAGATHLTPMRWFSDDPASLDLLEGSPVNALLVDGPTVSPEFAREAARRKVQVYRIDLRDRASLACAPGTDAVLATAQGVWPGIRFDESGISAGPTGSPWIESNSGFVRFLRSQSDSEIWMAQRVRAPGRRGAVTTGEYLRAIADAALGGGRWAIDLDREFQQALLRRDAARLRDWHRIVELLRYFDEHPAWTRYKPASGLAVTLDCRMGALSGGVLDLFASQHIPVRPLTAARVGRLRSSPAAAVVNLTRTPLPTPGSAVPFLPPEGWTFPPSAGDAFEISPAQSTALGFVYELTRDGSLRMNFGARLFNVAGALSNLVANADGGTVLLHIVNYTDYPMEQITVDLDGACRSVRLWRPGRESRELAREKVQGGVRVEVDRIDVVASLECAR